VTPLERDVARSVVAFLETCGCHVYSLQDRRPRATRNTPGLPDLYVLHRQLGGFWVELKAPGGKQTVEQVSFQATCGRCGVPYVCGGVAEAMAFLAQRGLVVTP